MIEQLTPDRVLELWPQLEPIVAKACASNEISDGEITAQDILVLLQVEQATSFASFDERGLATFIVFQFHTVVDRKGVDVICLCGRRLMWSAKLYWDYLKDWLRKNDVQFIDAYANQRIASFYLKHLGFTKSAVYVRTPL